MQYNWQQADWPDFRYDPGELEDKLYSFAGRAGRIEGLLAGVPADRGSEIAIDLMVAEAIKTSAIEGEYLSREDVQSSIRNNLGLNHPQQRVSDLRAQGAAELMVAIRRTYRDPLTEPILFTWHRMIMKGNQLVQTGAWRDHRDPMQVISGPVGRFVVHYEAPPSNQVPVEMKRFIRWFNNTGPGGKYEIKKAVVRAGIAHLYFESIHPFEDGNGRIGRAIAEKALSQTLGRSALLSLSRVFESDRKAYYAALGQAQRSNEITAWLKYFAAVALEAQVDAESMVAFTLKKTLFFDRFRPRLNARQTKVARRMLAEGPNGFEGGMSAKKYIAITRCSKATATRDLRDLVDKEVFLISGAGRSTRYTVNLV